MKRQCLFSSAESEVLGISDLMRTLTYLFTLRQWTIENTSEFVFFNLTPSNVACAHFVQFVFLAWLS